MLDYKLLEALAAVVDEHGFEKAARRLHITQSAVSQRIKALEETIGRILLDRSNPPAATRFGTQILAHYRKVKQLEQEFLLFQPSSAARYADIAVGINADSLATWFWPAIRTFLHQYQVTLDLKVDDQEQTFKFLKSGTVWGCVSTNKKSAPGCKADFLGTMRYSLYCTPRFYKIWFADGLSLSAIKGAPIFRFNRHDFINDRIFATYFQETPAQLPTFYIPSSEKFMDMIAAGLGYGALPTIQCAHLVEQGVLVECLPDNNLDIPLYWHRWNIRTELLESFSDHLFAGARKYLS